MKFIKEVELYKRLHKCIEQSNTGSPEELARKLHISRAQLYNCIGIIKELGGPVKYSRILRSFYYTTYYELEIDVKIKAITAIECKTIFAGIVLHQSSVQFNR